MSGGKHWGSKQVLQKPEGQIRQSQIVTTFGPGAMVDLVDHAVLITGLDHWQYASGKTTELAAMPRLREQLRNKLKIELCAEGTFREPPIGDDRNPSPLSGIPVIEFPKWFVCQECRALVHARSLDVKGGKYQHRCDRRTGSCVPVRFVMACRRGHLEEFPWVHFAHQRGERCAAPQLKLEESASGDFSEIRVRCACDQSERLSTAHPFRCKGGRPWLGSEDDKECGELLRLLVRTASNSYFAQVMSALCIDEPGRELEQAVERLWDVLCEAEQESLPTLRRVPKVRDDLTLREHDDCAVLKAVDAKRSGETSLLPLRTAEFLQFVQQKPEAPGDSPRETDRFFARALRPKAGLPAGIERVVLAHKLRELRVHVGFTRLEPQMPNLEGEFDLGVEVQRLALAQEWLPGIEMQGEGIFIQLGESEVRAWESRVNATGRAEALRAGYQHWATTVTGAPPFPEVRFYLLHSLSHLLMSAISLECGYSASALRERIYCAPADAETPMAAILIMTGGNGTEGTLGGLVQQGHALQSHVQRAFDLGVLCSNDPVCAAHAPHQDPAERWLEGAACHSCLFVAECSCERSNRFLDRALVVPTLGHPAGLAFFQRRP